MLLLTHTLRFSSVQFLDQLGHWGNMRDDSTEILFQSFLQEALVSSSGMGRDAHSSMLSTQPFLCQSQHRPPSKVPRRTVLDRLSRCVTHLNQASFCLLRVARIGSCVDPLGSWSCSAPSCWSCAPNMRYGDVFSTTRLQKPGSFFPQSASMVRVSHTHTYTRLEYSKGSLTWRRL